MPNSPKLFFCPRAARVMERCGLRYNRIMTKPRSFAPIIAAFLLLLPVLYVGSYLALVEPQGILGKKQPGSFSTHHYYRIDNNLVTAIFWPLERLDRKLRPKAWEIDPFG